MCLCVIPVSWSVVTAAVRPTPVDPRPVVGMALGAVWSAAGVDIGGKGVGAGMGSEGEELSARSSGSIMLAPSRGVPRTGVGGGVKWLSKKSKDGIGMLSSSEDDISDVSGSSEEPPGPESEAKLEPELEAESESEA